MFVLHVKSYGHSQDLQYMVQLNDSNNSIMFYSDQQCKLRVFLQQRLDISLNMLWHFIYETFFQHKFLSNNFW